MGPDGVLTTIDVEPEIQREARRAFESVGRTRSRTRVIRGRASDVLPRMAARFYDMVVLDVEPKESAALIDQALRMLRMGGVLAVTRVSAKEELSKRIDLKSVKLMAIHGQIGGGHRRI